MESLSYIVKRSRRKSISLRIEPNGDIVVRAPMRVSHAFIESWVHSKKAWIQKHMPLRAPKVWNDHEIHAMKQALLAYIAPKTKEIWNKYSLPKYTHISITKAERRWGSCSAHNRLCFSYRLAEFLDEYNQYPNIPKNIRYAYIDAIIVHELCHLQEKHHRKPFWNLVYSIMPEYEDIILAVRKGKDGGIV